MKLINPATEEVICEIPEDDEESLKKKFVAFALVICAIVSVTSGCVVREGYGGHRYHNHDRGGHWHHDRDYNRGY